MSTPDRTDYAGADPRWSCARKKAYPTQELAAKVARKVCTENPGVNVVAYGCTHCGSYHIGRAPGA